ncbi:hypothetical protein [Paenibacillus camelliae]|uniref:hypothetical protein n=1 Tax=Paenibacillus camelliae TaxID=512410 RepID=UPI00203E07C4|nr:hypothetical protein [Paenibacillus camelliae]MCM3633238.1 hypothetical protein [Paenibacillus camelliae]
MGILDLIFDNIYVVVVVLFFLFKFMGNFSGNKKQTGMPTFGGDQPNQWDDNEVDTEPTTSYNRESAPDTGHIQTTPPQRVLQREVERVNYPPETAERSFEDIKREQQRRQELAKQRVAAAQKLMEAPAKSAQLGTKDLREAVIWSEILGKPRAKRPYRSR